MGDRHANKTKQLKQISAQEKTVTTKEVAAEVVDFGKRSPVWRFHAFDLDGPHGEDAEPYGWKCMNRTELCDLRTKLGHLESMTWNEMIRNRHCHPISHKQLSKEARDRLDELKYDDIDGLFQISFSNTERLFGIKDRYIFKILWWDPDHKVYPVEKKNT